MFSFFFGISIAEVDNFVGLGLWKLPFPGCMSIYSTVRALDIFDDNLFE